MSSAFTKALLGGAVGGLPGAFIGATIGGAEDANDARQQIAADANQFSAAQFATRYQTQVKDMQAAGLNPMLSYFSAPPSAPTGQQYQYQNPYENISRDYASAANVAAQGYNIEADTYLKGSQFSLNEAQKSLVSESVDKVKQEIVNLKTTNEQVKALIENLRVEYQNLVKEGYNKTETGNMLRATVDKLKVELPYIGQKSFQAEMAGQLDQARRKLLGFDITAAQDMGNLGRELGQAEPALKLLLRIFGK